MSDKIVIRVSGMSCASCSARIEKALKKIGVISVNANFSENTVFVEYDPKKLSLDDVKDSIRASGYNVLDGDDQEIIEKQKEEAATMKRDLFISVIFTIPLMIIAMGPMLIGSNIPIEHPILYSLIQLILCIPVLISGRRFFMRGIPSLFRGSPTMDTLIAVGTLAAIVYSLYNTYLILTGDIHAVHSLFFDSAAMIIALVSVGKYLESRSKVKTNDAVKGLIDLAPSTAEIEIDGRIEIVDTRDVSVGQIAIIRPGMSVSVDGIVIEGTSNVNESMLTGESMPVRKIVGSKVSGGTVNIDGVLRVKVVRTGDDTVLSQMVRMVKDAQGTKAPVARIADKVAAVFVPIVILIAISSFILWMIAGKSLEFSLIVLISVLVISCPCALGLATPLAITVGTGMAAEHGILFKDAASLERSGKITHVIFDKTGTLTEGKPNVVSFDTIMDRHDFISLAASIESLSEHPIAKAITAYATENNIEFDHISNMQSDVGKGISGKIKGKTVSIGNSSFIESTGVDIFDLSESKGMTRVYVAIDSKYAGSIDISDTVKDSSECAVHLLRSMDVNVSMVTGDSKDAAESIASEVGIENIISSATPADKIMAIKKLQAKSYNVSMVGDGINDSPALMQSDLGIAIGSGTDIAIDSASVILMNNDLRSVPATIEVGKKVMKAIKENLAFAFCYNAICIPIAAGLPYVLGMPDFIEMPMLAALAMSLSSISVILNTLRLKRQSIVSYGNNCKSFK